jgi:hypothetical protein
MDARNKFLESYKKKTQEQGLDVHTEGSPAEAAGGVKEGVPPEEEVSLKFEQKPGFIKPEPKPITPASRSSKKINRYVGITLGVVILLGIIIGTVLLFNRGVEVIDLVGWTENDAQLWAREKGVNLQVEKEYSDEVEAGKVISQSVTATFHRSGTFMLMPPNTVVKSKNAPSSLRSASRKSRSILPNIAVAFPPLKSWDTHLFSKPEKITKWFNISSLDTGIPVFLGLPKITTIPRSINKDGQKYLLISAGNISSFLKRKKRPINIRISPDTEECPLEKS